MQHVLVTGGAGSLWRLVVARLSTAGIFAGVRLFITARHVQGVDRVSMSRS